MGAMLGCQHGPVWWWRVQVGCDAWLSTWAGVSVRGGAWGGPASLGMDQCVGGGAGEVGGALSLDWCVLCV